MSVAARVSTSATPSTTMPVETGLFRRITWTTMIQVRSVYSRSGRPNLRRRSTTGMTLPRRLITPFTWAGGLRQGGEVAHSHDFADLQNPNAELFGTQFEDEVLSGAVVAVEQRRRIFL